MANRILLTTGWLALCAAVVIGRSEAYAETCAPPTPACHLENGKRLIEVDPRRAAEELLASYQLDERTETLELYARALERAHRYALALETWKRIIVFRDSEVETAKETLGTATGRKAAAARKTMERAQTQSEQAAAAIIKLWPEVGRVRVQLAPGSDMIVTHDGVEVDASRDVLVNAGRDELVFTRKDGSVERVVVEVAAGALAKIDAPSATVVAKVEPAPAAEKVVARPERSTTEEKPVARPERSTPGDEKLAAKQSPPEDGDGADAQDEARPLATVMVDQPRSRTMSRIGLGLVAGAVVAGGLAGGFGYAASRDHDRARDAGCNADDQCPFGPAADLANRSNDRARIAQISATAAGALLATGVTLWIVGRSKTDRAAPEVALHVGLSSTAISWRF
ncbi:MAG TPA: hypothetical protein VLM79_22940 [Kofleriaceae bacterium]|nr:hypothetical protein [Kofleriaceae bacterium]